MVDNGDSVVGSDHQTPFIDYTGKIIYYTDFMDIAFACDNLLTWVEKQQPNEPQMIVPIAFDMEWPFTFKTGSGKTAIIQLCATLDVCYVFHVSRLRKLPAALLTLLYHSRVCLHGVNIKNDFRKLQRDFPEVKAEVLISQCKELGVWFNTITRASGLCSLERLVMNICRLRINKDKRIRMSRWDTYPLSKEQQLYAAIDVYIGQVIYNDLLERETKMQKLDEENAVPENKKDLKALKSSITSNKESEIFEKTEQKKCICHKEITVEKNIKNKSTISSLKSQHLDAVKLHEIIVSNNGDTSSGQPSESTHYHKITTECGQKKPKESSKSPVKRLSSESLPKPHLPKILKDHHPNSPIVDLYSKYNIE